MSFHSSSSSSRVSSERSSTSGDHEAFNSPTVKRRLAAAPRTLTSIAQDEKTQNSVWKHISSGLPRAKRPFDLNRIDLVFPAELFFPPTPATSESEGSEHNTRITQLYSSPWATKYGAVDALALHDRPVSTNAGIGALPQDASHALSPDPVAYNPVSILGAGRVDPFASYPIKMHRGEMWLLDQVNTAQDQTFRTFRERWLGPSIEHSATFHQFLSNVSLNLSRVRGEALDNPVTVAHHSLAIRSVNKQLADPNFCTSDCVVTSILSFICYNTVKDDLETVGIHLNGLAKVIELRGGFEVLSKSPLLANFLYGVETTRICRHDSRSLFPVPERVFDTETERLVPTELSRRPTSNGQWWQIFPREHPIIDIFDCLLSVLELAHLKAAKKESWQTVNFLLCNLYSTMHALMGLKIQECSNDHWIIIQEASRLAIFMFLGDIRRQCGALGVSTRVFVAKFKALMIIKGCSIDWSSAYPLLLWMLFFGLLESNVCPEYDWYLESFVTVANRMNLDSWSSVIENVKGFLWIDEVHDDKVREIQGIVTAKLHSVADDTAS